MLPDAFDVLKMDKRDLHPLPGGQVNIALAVPLCNLMDGFQLLKRQVAASYPQTDGKIITLNLFQKTTLFKLRKIKLHLFVLSQPSLL